MKHLTIGILLVMLSITGCQNMDRNGSAVGIAEGTTIVASSVNGGALEVLSIEEGHQVRAGEVIAVLDTLDVHLRLGESQAALLEIAVQRDLQRHRIAQAETDLEWIRLQTDRTRALVEDNAAPRQKLDDLQAQLDKAREALKTARGQMAVFSASEDRIRAAMKTLRHRITLSVVRSPLDGTVTDLYYRQGENVPPMGAIAEITSLDEMEVTLWVPSKKLPSIHTGQPIAVTADGIETPLKGEVEWISPNAEFTPNQILTAGTRSSLVYAVRLRVPNPEGLLKHGMPVEILENQ